MRISPLVVLATRASGAGLRFQPGGFNKHGSRKSSNVGSDMVRERDDTSKRMLLGSDDGISDVVRIKGPDKSLDVGSTFGHDERIILGSPRRLVGFDDSTIRNGKREMPCYPLL